MSKIVIFFLFLSQILFAGSFPIVAEATGKTLKEAKNSALASISQQISVEIKSEFNSSMKSSSSGYSKNIEAIIKTNSSIPLQGVKFKVLNSKNRQYVVKASFDYSSYNKTINWLIPKTNKSIEFLDTKSRKEMLKTILYLNTLVSYGDSLDVDIQDLKKKEDLLLKYINMARLRVVTKPKDAILMINNKRYKSNKIVFLKEGKNILEVKKDTFVSDKRNIYIYKGKLQTINIELVKNNKNNIGYSVLSDNVALQEAAQEALVDFGYKINGDGRVIKIILKKSIAKVDDIYIAKVTLKLNAYKNNIFLKSIKGKFKVNGYKDDIDDKISDKASRIIKKAIKKLLIKIQEI